jgi:hypothetical protein
MSASVATPQDSPAGASHSDRRGSSALGSYAEADTGRTREILSLHQPDGSILVIDRRASALHDTRLVAHLLADEAPENARLIAQMYLADESKGRCRRLTREDLELTFVPESGLSTGGAPVRLRDAQGHIYRIRGIPTAGSVPRLRWTRSRRPGREDPFVVVTLRDVITSLEDYEPARTMTVQALAAGRNSRFSTCWLRGELARVDCSATVLNRGLREAVQRRVAHGQLSMSEIARRCGRTRAGKRPGGGEASWLARRIGEHAESGEASPSPWINSDVLAMIARDGLGVSPHEVEL